jgi:hypothetical protein
MQFIQVLLDLIEISSYISSGVIATSLVRYYPGPFRWLWTHVISHIFLKSIPQGAATSIYCATAPEAENEDGLFFADCKVQTPDPLAENEEIANKLWEISLQMTGAPDIKA